MYDFQSHYLYRSKDLRRVSGDTLAKYSDHEIACATCHVEHRGKDAPITVVTDMRCLSCHDFGSFKNMHPEFEFVKKKLPDDSTLIMTHNRHTNFVLAQLEGVDRIDSQNIVKWKKAAGPDSLYFFEKACLYCHNPEPDGKNFTNISFDVHCVDCHLGDKVLTGLPVFDPKRPYDPGVETLKDIQNRGGPGVTWVFIANPGLFINDDGELSKGPIFHKDPWIMENLKQIRKKLYQGEGLYDLLYSTGSVSQSRVDTLYNKAIQTLKKYIIELRYRPELQNEITQLNAFLKIARDRLKNPQLFRSQTNFLFPFDMENPELSDDQKNGFTQLIFDLTDINGPECQKCHIIENASFRYVQADQDVLERSEFDHRAHVLEKRCTECHSDILINEQTLKLSTDNVSKFKEVYAEVYERDRASTQNIPKIASCQKCHSPKKVANTCVTCHKFHPNKKSRSGLQLFTTNSQD